MRTPGRALLAPQMSDVYSAEEVSAAASTAPEYVRLAERLRRSIVVGRRPVGGRLPSEATLADQFGVSRSTVREALRQLSSWGLVVTTRGVDGGTRIARLDRDHIGEMLNLGITLLSRYEEITVSELLETRELLEVPATRLATARRTEEHLRALEMTAQEVRPGSNMRDIFQANRAFHNVVLDASGNRLLNLITEPLFDVLQTRFLRDRADPDFWTKVVVDHRRVLRAIRRGDAEAAGRSMALHLRNLRGTYERIDSNSPVRKARVSRSRSLARVVA